jgi:nicotinate phosphoribosyltransferase
VDTYDTLEGIRTAVAVIRELELSGRIAIRLDSGDLDALARNARGILDDAGLEDVRIFASGGLDEFHIAELVRANAPIDAFGVGTLMGVAADAPYLDTVYKLVQYGDRPVMKLSAGKATAPGPKQVFRGEHLDDDLIGLRDEEPPVGRERLLVSVMRGGRRVAPRGSIAQGMDRFQRDLGALPTPAGRIADPVPPRPGHTAAFERLRESARAHANR